MLHALAAERSQPARVVAARRPRRRRAPVRGRGRASCWRSCPTPTGMVCYSPPDAGRPPGDAFDVAGRLTASGDRRAGGPPVDADFYLCGPERVHARHRAPRSTARGAAPDRVAQRGLRAPRTRSPRGSSAGAPSHRRIRRPAMPGSGPPISFAAATSRCPGTRRSAPARVRRGLRRPGSVVLPHRRLPHLRDRAGVAARSLRPRAARAARARRRPDLLLPAAGELVLDL